MAKITYENKVSLNPQPSVANKNKVTDADMNEIKSSVNDLYDNVSVLWTNNDITSDFIGQQISLSDSLNNYIYYEILFLMSKHETMGVSTGKINSAYSTSLMTLRNASTIGTISRYRDATRTTDTKIDFSACSECRGGATTVATANDRVIPYKIIGYKY